MFRILHLNYSVFQLFNSKDLTKDSYLVDHQLLQKCREIIQYEQYPIDIG